MAATPTSPATAMRRPAISLALVLLLALLLRVGLFAAAVHNAPDLHTLYTDDTNTYLSPAKSLLADGTFFRENVPEVIRTPGYPLFLALGLLAGHVELVTVAVQLVLGLASVALVHHIAWKLTANSTAALLAGVLAALEPLSIVFTSHLMPETLFTFLLLASLALLLHYLRASAAISLVATALLLAAATFVRPVSYYLPLAIALLLLVRALIRHTPTERTSVSSRDRLREAVFALAMAAVCFAPLAAWQVRNYLVSGYAGFSAIADWNLYFYQGLSIVSRQSGKPLVPLQLEMGQNDIRLFESLHPQLRDAGQAARFRFLQAEGSRLVRQNLATYAKIHARGTAILAVDPGTADLLGILDRYPQGVHGLKPLQNGIGETLTRMHREVPHVLYLSLVLEAALMLVYAGSALGLLVALRRLDWQWTLVLATLAYFVAVSGGPTGCARLRQPVMPVICILAGYGAAVLVGYLRAARQLRITHSTPGSVESQLRTPLELLPGSHACAGG